jgi:hypothetical protein
VVPCSLVPPLFAGRALMALGAALVLASCATMDSPRRSSDSSPSLRCLNDPGRGYSSDSSRPLFFLVCAQSP